MFALLFLAFLGVGPALVAAGNAGLPFAQAPAQLSGALAVVGGEKPHGPYIGTTSACAACHSTHTAGFAGLLGEPNDEPSQVRVCVRCHGPGGGAPEVSTHTNKDYSGATQAPFYRVCSDCHNPHASANLKLVKTTILTATVNFKAQTGNDSYDDGYDDGRSDSVCVACHTKTAHNKASSTELQGQGHNPVGTRCTTCHSHGNSIAQRSGFMPSEGACLTCHRTVQGPRRQIVDDAGNGAGSGGDFVRASHHVQPAAGTVKAADCTVCHDTLAHRQGTVRLRDPDNPNTIIAFTGAASLEPFCLNCHDADGAKGILAPFSDGKSVPNVKGSGGWTASSHKVAAGKTCYDCHDNGHGSNLKRLLKPYNGAPGADRAAEEEGFCYACHGPGGSAPDVKTQFERTSRHQVSYNDQIASGASLECTSCHDPHLNTRAQPLVDPDNRSVLWSGGDRDFCLRCHDGSPPAPVTFPATAPGTGWSKGLFAGSRHDVSLTGPAKCQECHERHGSNEYSLLKGKYNKVDNTSYTYGDGKYGLCFSCHQESKVVTDSGGRAAVNAFEDRHKLHVRDERTPCMTCHDVHYPYDAGESGLINYVYGVGKQIVSLTAGSTTYNYSTAFQIDGSGIRGACYLTCHSQRHSPETYRRTPTDTTGPVSPMLPVIAIPAVTPTATMTLSPTATVLPTPTTSPAPTLTPYPTPTPMRTPSPASTPSGTPTPLGSPTATPTRTPTPAAVISPAPTPALSPTASPTQTSSPTASPTPAAALTPTPWPSASPTQPPAHSHTATATPAATPTPTAAAGALTAPTPSASPSATPAPAGTVTAGPSPTQAPAPEQTPTPAPTPTPTSMPTTTPMPTPTAEPPIPTPTSPPPTPTLTPTALPTPTPTSPPPTPTLTPTALPTPTPTSPPPTPTLTTTALPTPTPTVKPTSTPTPPSTVAALRRAGGRTPDMRANGRHLREGYS